MLAGGAVADDLLDRLNLDRGLWPALGEALGVIIDGYTSGAGIDPLDDAMVGARDGDAGCPSLAPQGVEAGDGAAPAVGAVEGGPPK